MPYCVVADVQAKLQHVAINTTSDPSEAEVLEFCSEVSESMDARFRSVGITTPVTDASLLKVVKPIAVNGVAAEVLRSIQMEPDAAQTRQDLFDSAMKNIENRPAVLQTQSVTGSPGGYIPPSGTERAFSRGDNKW